MSTSTPAMASVPEHPQPVAAPKPVHKSASGPYILLQKYSAEAMLLSQAYKLSEYEYIYFNKLLSYPTVVLGAAGTVLAGVDVHRYVLMGISLASLMLAGFTTVINPMQRVHAANTSSTEFGQISASIYQFVLENGKSKEEVKRYSQVVQDQLGIWKSQAPPLRPRLLEQARREHHPRMRGSEDGLMSCTRQEVYARSKEPADNPC